MMDLQLLHIHESVVNHRQIMSRAKKLRSVYEIDRLKIANISLKYLRVINLKVNF